MELTIKKAIVELKIYSVLVRTDRGDFLHMGAHYTLEDAFNSAKIKAFEKFYTDSGMTRDEVDYNVNLWCKSEARDIIKVLLNNKNDSEKEKKTEKNKIETIDEKINEISSEKNKLMKQLINDKDIRKIKLASKILSKNDIAYIENEINKKKQ